MHQNPCPPPRDGRRAGRPAPLGAGLRRACLEGTQHGTLALMTEGAGGLGVVTDVPATWLSTGVTSLGRVSQRLRGR